MREFKHSSRKPMLISMFTLATKGFLSTNMFAKLARKKLLLTKAFKLFKKHLGHKWTFIQVRLTK